MCRHSIPTYMHWAMVYRVQSLKVISHEKTCDTIVYMYVHVNDVIFIITTNGGARPG